MLGTAASNPSVGLEKEKSRRSSLSLNNSWSPLQTCLAWHERAENASKGARDAAELAFKHAGAVASAGRHSFRGREGESPGRDG